MTVPVNDPAAADEAGFVAEHFGVRLRTSDAPTGVAVSDLIRLGLRRNPRRAHLLVSQVLGKHLPVDPRVAVGIGRLLGELVGNRLDGSGDPLPTELGRAAVAAVAMTDPGALLAALPRPAPASRGVLVLGCAETATALGHLVSDQLGATHYLHSTRRAPGPVPVTAAFTEGHSHAPDHLLRPCPPELLDADDIAVVVDDELSTGRTAAATITALHQRRARSHYVVATLVDVRGESDRAELDRVAAGLGTRIDVVAIASGELDLPSGLSTAVARWLTATSASPTTVPPSDAVSVTSQAAHVVSAVPAEPSPTAPPAVTWVPRPSRRSGGRYGVTSAGAAELEDLIVDVADATWPAVARTASPAGRPRRVLVLGTEEYMYLPLRVAANWRNRAPEVLLDVRFQSTTRSPVAPWADDGYPIRRVFTFRPCEADETGDRFLYNACWPDGSEPDCVVVFLDEDADCAAVLGPGGLVFVLAEKGGPVVVSGLVDADTYSPDIGGRPAVEHPAPRSSPDGRPE